MSKGDFFDIYITDDERHECYDAAGKLLGTCYIVVYREGWEQLDDHTIAWDMMQLPDELPDPEFVYLPDRTSIELIQSLIDEFDGCWVYVLTEDDEDQAWYEAARGELCEYQYLPAPLQDALHYVPDDWKSPRMMRF